MVEHLSFAEAAARARVITAALALGRRLDLWSLALVTLSLVSLVWVSLPFLPTICLLVSLLAGGAQKIFALRVAFDEALFRDWSQTWINAASQDLDSTELAADFAALDHVLSICGLRAPPGEVVRDMDSRLRGAWILLRQQALALTIQFTTMICAVAVICLLPVG